MINEAAATKFATDAGLAVSKTLTRKVESDGKVGTIRTLTVGAASVWYDTRIGGAACWKVTFNNVIHRGGFKGEAIYRAYKLQTA